MNGIDISKWQKGINLAAVPCDFVIIKATQGVSYTSPEFKTQITQAISLGKRVGVYHYANGAGVDIEANHFVEVIKPYIGQVILAVDWENNKDKKTGANDNPKFVAGDYKYCEKLLAAIKERTGVIPFLYMSKSVARQYKWELGKNYPFWCAQYKSYAQTGYQGNPWTDTKGWGAWKGCQILQYSSKGRLPGYSGDLDLDKAYISAEEWDDYARGDMVIDLSAKPILRKGDHNEYVRAWQTFLNMNGYDVGKAGADGKFGDDTEKAVVKWQQDHGIEAGYIGPQTWETI